MIISTAYDAFGLALSEVMPVFDDKLVQEEMKNLIFWVQGDKVRLVANNLYTTCTANLPATVTYAEGEQHEEEQFIQVKAKELKQYLSSLHGLRCTMVDKVELEIRPNEMRLLVSEVPIDKEDVMLKSLAQTSKFRLTKTAVIDRVKTELRNADAYMVSTEGFTKVDRGMVMPTLNALVPMVTKEFRDTVHTRVTFVDDYIYVIPQTYAALMHNGLPDALKGFVVTNSAAQFMQSFFSIDEATEFKQVEVKGDSLMLVLKNSTATATILATNTNKAFNIAKQKVLPNTGVAVHKGYFADVLKRINTTNSEITFNITLDADVTKASCTVVNKLMTQSIPVMASRGEGEYSFTIKPDLLSAITFNSVNTGGTMLFLYLTKDETGKITLCVTDDIMVTEDNAKHAWHTYTKGLAVMKGDFQW